MMAADASIPEMAQFLWPNTAEFLENAGPEVAILALTGLRSWLTIVERDPAFKPVMSDPFLMGQCVDEFIKAYVATYEERTDA